MGLIRTIFMGSPEFAVPSLNSLAQASEIDVSLVVTQPDRRAGRGRSLRPPAVKVAAENLDIPVFQPETLRTPEAVDRLRREQADLIVVVSFGEILRKEILELTPHGCLNVHPSLLPSYRGSTPIPAAILNGDDQTGVSIIKLVRRMDAGPVVDQVDVTLDGSETTGMLSEQLATIAGERLPKVIFDWVSGAIESVEQDEAAATYTRELRKADGQIDWRWPAEYIERFVRAMDPWPGAWTNYNGQRIAIQRVSQQGESEASHPAGTLIAGRQDVELATGDGLLVLDRVQPAGKKPMPATDWIRGFRDEVPASLENPEHDRDPIIFTRGTSG